MSEALEQVDSGFDKLRAAGRNLWLAGLGAVAEVEEGGRQLFDRLVERGRPVEGKLEEKLEGTQKKLAETVGQRVEKAVELESRGVLERLNLMTREDVRILAARLESLSQQIDEYAVRREAAAPKTRKTTKTVKAAGKGGVKKG